MVYGFLEGHDNQTGNIITYCALERAYRQVNVSKHDIMYMPRYIAVECH